MFKNSIWLVKLLLLGVSLFSQSQNLIQNYDPAKRDSLRIGPEKNDQLAFIQAGYTLMTPESGTIDGVLIFLEDSGFDNRNSNAKSMYQEATNNNFAVLSVSTELPFDFYFTTSSLETAQNIIESILLSIVRVQWLDCIFFCTIRRDRKAERFYF